MISTPRNSESGNAFYIILLGVVLFGALMFTFSKGARQGSTNLSQRQVKLAVSDTLDYAQSLERATDRLLTGGISESDICFDTDAWGSNAYNYAACSDDKNQVFSAAGGAASFKTPVDGLGHGLVWTFTGAQSYAGVGTDCAADQSCKDLVAAIDGISLQACLAINTQLGIDNPSGAPPSAAQISLTDPYKGVFATPANHINVAQLNGKSSGCYRETNTDQYIFYHVLIAR
jgi:hypothetical protein